MWYRFHNPLVVDEKFLDVESHSLMLVNWQNTSPSHFLLNPTFGVISTTERLFSKPQTTDGGNYCLEFLVQLRWGCLHFLASTSYPFPSLLVRWTQYSYICKHRKTLELIEKHDKHVLQLTANCINFASHQWLPKSSHDSHFSHIFLIEDTWFHCFTQVTNRSL